MHSCCTSLGDQHAGASSRTHDFHMRAAAAQVAGQGLGDFLVGGRGLVVEQGHQGHDHAVGAVAALGGLLVDERLLHRVQSVDGLALCIGCRLAGRHARHGGRMGCFPVTRHAGVLGLGRVLGQAFQRRDLHALDHAHGNGAGAGHLAVDQHGACAAFAQAAAELGAVELHVVAQHIKQRRLRADALDLDLLLVESEFHRMQTLWLTTGANHRCALKNQATGSPRPSPKKKAHRQRGGLFSRGF